LWNKAICDEEKGGGGEWGNGDIGEEDD